MSRAPQHTPRFLVAAEAAGLFWALGLAVFTSACFVLYLAHVLSTPTVAVALAASVLGAGVVVHHLVRVRRESGHSAAARSGDRRPAALHAVALGLVALQVALCVWQTLATPQRGWDAWANWELKARMFAQGGPPLAYFHDSLTATTHPNYPLLLPLAEAAGLRLGGPLAPVLNALLGPACLLALCLLLYAGLGRLYGGTVAATGTALLALVPALPEQAAGGYADVPLCLYAGGATLYLLLWWRLRRGADALLLGLLAGGAVWTKKEGAAIAAILVLAFVLGEVGHGVQGKGRGGARRVRLMGCAGVLLAAGAIPLPWLLFSALAHPIGTDVLPLSLHTFAQHADRLPHLMAALAQQLLAAGTGSVLWLGLAGGVVLRVGQRRLSRCAQGLLLVLAAQLGVDLLSYVFSDWQPYTAHVATSLDRLVLQAVPLAVLLVCELSAAVRAPAPWPAAAQQVSQLAPSESSAT